MYRYCCHISQRSTEVFENGIKLHCLSCHSKPMMSDICFSVNDFCVHVWQKLCSTLLNALESLEVDNFLSSSNVELVFACIFWSSLAPWRMLFSQVSN